MRNNELQIRIGKNLKRLREQKKLSQTDLALRMGPTVRPTWVSSVENGHRGVGKKMLQRICKALAVDPSELMTPESPPQPLDEDEQGVLSIFREAKKEGVAEEWLRYGRYKINDQRGTAKNKK